MFGAGSNQFWKTFLSYDWTIFCKVDPTTNFALGRALLVIARPRTTHTLLFILLINKQAVG